MTPLPTVLPAITWPGMGSAHDQARDTADLVRATLTASYEAAAGPARDRREHARQAAAADYAAVLADIDRRHASDLASLDEAREQLAARIGAAQSAAADATITLAGRGLPPEAAAWQAAMETLAQLLGQAAALAGRRA